MPDGFVIDNSVLSACYRQGWMGLLAFRAEASEVLVSEHVWDGEFLDEFDDVTEPVWLAVEEATRYPYFPDAPTALGAADLSCLGLASEYSYAAEITTRAYRPPLRTRRTPPRSPTRRRPAPAAWPGRGPRHRAR